MTAIILFASIVLLGAVFGNAVRDVVGGKRGAFWGSALVAAGGGFAAGSLAPAFGVGAEWPLVATVLGCFTVYIGDRAHERALREALEQSSRISDFGLGNFDEIDADGDDVVTAGDLIACLDSVMFGEHQQELMVLILNRLRDIGRPVDSFAMPTMSIGGPGMYHTAYGITREDFETYPARLKAQYEREYGPLDA